MEEWTKSSINYLAQSIARLRDAEKCMLESGIENRKTMLNKMIDAENILENIKKIISENKIDEEAEKSKYPLHREIPIRDNY